MDRDSAGFVQPARAVTRQLTPIRRHLEAELRKLATLPGAWATAGLTLGVTTVAAFILSGQQHQATTTSSESLAATVRLAQVAFIALGALAAGSEFSNGQIRITFLTNSSPVAVLTAKSLAYLTVAIPLAGATIAGLGLLGDLAPLNTTTASLAHLTLVGLFAHNVAIVQRGLLAPLVTALIVAVVAPAVLVPLTTWGRLLPHASQLGSAHPETGSPGRAAATALAWTAASALASGLSLNRRDL